MVTDLKQLCGNKYRVADDGTNDSVQDERIWCLEVKGRFGVIYPQGHDGSLAMRIDSNVIAQKAKRSGLRVITSGDDETIFAIQPGQIDEGAKWIQAYKKRHISPEQKARLAEMGKKYHFAKAS